jgi:hypothetical protein
MIKYALFNVFFTLFTSYLKITCLYYVVLRVPFSFANIILMSTPIINEKIAFSIK